jgi:ribosomal protein S27AE
MAITVIDRKSAPVNKASIECPSCTKPVTLANRGDRLSLPKFCPNCGAALSITAEGGGEATAVPRPDDDQATEKSAVDFSRMNRDQISAMVRAVSVAVSKAIPNGTPAEQRAAIERACPGLMSAHAATVAQSATTSIAKQARVQDAKQSVLKAIEAGATEMIRAGLAPTKEQAVAKLLKNNPSLYQQYRDAGR